MTILSSARFCFAVSRFHKKKINEVYIEAKQHYISEYNIKWLLDIKPGDLYSEKSIQKGIKTVYLKNFFSNIIVQAKEVDGKVDLIFILIPKIRIKKIEFEGNDYFWKSVLRRKVTIRNNDEFYEKNIAESVKRLEEYYKKEGFLNIKVGYEVKELENQYQKGVVFNIVENDYATVKDISFSFPNIKFDEEVMKEVIDLNPGDRFSKGFSKDVIKKDVIKKARENLERYLIANDYYDLDNIKFDYKEEQKVRLKIIVDVPYKVRFIFFGNEIYSDKKLFSFFDFVKQKSSNVKVIKYFVDEIMTFYKEKGFYFARITIGKNKDDPSEGVKITNELKVIKIYVTEGKRVKIKKIRFSGNKRYDDERLMKQMLTSESGTFINDYLIERVLADDIKALEFLYQKDGFLDVEVNHAKIFNEEKDSVTLEIKIDEGEQTFISQIDFEGISDENMSDVQKMVGTKVGYAINIYRIEDEKTAIRESYKKKGYYNVKVDIKSKFLPDNKIHLKYIVDEGIKAQIRKLIISDNDFTKRKVIRRETGLKEGDPYNLNDMLFECIDQIH
jgi:outer membrane protein assembly factor BamA